MTATSDTLSPPTDRIATTLVVFAAVFTGAAVVALYGEPLRAVLGAWWGATVLPIFLDAQLGELHICL